jgi:hypothetical protein
VAQNYLLPPGLMVQVGSVSAPIHIPCHGPLQLVTCDQPVEVTSTTSTTIKSENRLIGFVTDKNKQEAKANFFFFVKNRLL